MNKILLIAIMLVSFNIQAQGLKGYTLGEVYSESTVIFSLAGIDGSASLYKINDGRLYQLVWVPSDGININRSYKNELELLINGLENKFNISFTKKKVDSGTIDYYYYTIVNGVSYYLTVEENKYMDKPLQLGVMLVNEKLAKIADKELQNKADKDF